MRNVLKFELILVQVIDETTQLKKMFEFVFLILCVLSEICLCNHNEYPIDVRECDDLYAKSKDIFFEEGDEIFLNKFDRYQPIQTLNSMQLIRANRSSNWVSNYLEPYPVEHNNFYDHNYPRLTIITYKREAIEYHANWEFNNSFIVNREFNDRFLAHAVYFSRSFQPLEDLLSQKQYILRKDEPYRPYTYGLHGDRGYLKPGQINFRYPSKNGVVIKHTQAWFRLKIIKPIIGYDLRFIEKQFMVTIFPSYTDWRIVYYDEKYIVIQQKYKNDVYFVNFLIKQDNDRMVIETFLWTTCKINEKLKLEVVSNSTADRMVDKYFDECKKNLTSEIIELRSRPKSCPITTCPEYTCPPRRRGGCDIETEYTTKQTVTQRHVNQHVFRGVPGTKTRIQPYVPKHFRKLSTTIRPVTKPIEVQDQELPENKFKNQTFLLESAIHGISFHKTANVLIFDEVWIHVIKFEFPLKSFSPRVSDNKKYCDDFVKKMNIQSNETNKLKESFRIVCKNFETNLIEFSNNIKQTAQTSLNDFKDRQLTRSKRFIVESLVIVGIASAVVTVGGALGKLFYDVQNTKHDVQVLNNKFIEMERKIEALKINNQMIAENLIGFSKKVDAISKSFDKKLEILKLFMLNQTEQINELFNKTIDYIDQSSILHAIISTFNSYRLTQNMYLENQLNLLLDSIQNYENIFETLRNNRLPHSLISVQMLTTILSTIKEELKGSFDIALDEIDYHLFYSLPLVSFVIRKQTNEIFVTIKIPLKRANNHVLFDAIRPQFSGFPCLNKTCSKHTSLDLTNNLVSIYSSNNVWLTDSFTGELTYETTPGSLSCQITSNLDICMVFRTGRLTYPSECNRAIIDWNIEKIVDWCEFKLRSKDHYKPIPISYNKYIVHSSLIPKYNEICDNNKKEMIVNSWAEIIEAKVNCKLNFETINFSIQGPLGKPLTSNQTLNITTFHSELLELIQSDSNDTNFEFSELPLPSPDNKFITKFNISENPINTEWDSNQITAFSQYIYKMNLNISEEMTKLDEAFKTKFNLDGYYQIINSIGTIMQILATIIVIFGLISYSRLFGIYRAGIVLMTAHKTEAFSFVNPLENVKFISFSMIIDISMICFMVIIIITIIKLAWFRKNLISNHYGRGKPRSFEEDDCGHTLVLNIYFSRDKFCNLINEGIYIRLPIIGIRKGPIKDVRLMNAFTQWFVTKSEGKLILKTAEPIHIYSVDNNDSRLEDAWQVIRLPIEDIKWYYLPKPCAFNEEHNYGIAFLSISKDVSSQF